MIEITNDPKASADFQLAIEALKNAQLRDELVLEQITAPSKMAHEAVAFSVNVNPDHELETSDPGTGRFVLLHDLKPHDQWGSNFRIVTFSKSPLETNIGDDAEISNICWSWLLEALEYRGAQFSLEAGTATRIISTGHGSLDKQSDHAELELRASWTPTGDFGRHLEAWQDLVCLMSGYAIDPTKVASIKTRAR